MHVKYLETLRQPEFLAGAKGDTRELDESHALRLWGEGLVELVHPPAGLPARHPTAKLPAAHQKPSGEKRASEKPPGS